MALLPRRLSAHPRSDRYMAGSCQLKTFQSPHLCSAYNLRSDRGSVFDGGSKAQGIWSDMPRGAAPLFEETCYCELASVRSLLPWAKAQPRPDLGWARCSKLQTGSKSSACPSARSKDDATIPRHRFGERSFRGRDGDATIRRKLGFRLRHCSYLSSPCLF